jgi:hypothetical protein
MGSIWIKEMTGGLDTRRLPETTPGGVLIKAQDGHITRGGEFEKRAAFVKEYTLPAGTHGIAYDARGLVVFGTGAEPPGIPTGVSYQRLDNPDDSNQGIDRILSTDLYDKKLYVAVLYEDGSIYHFYDGSVVTDWFDGRARAQFTVMSGAITSAEAAVASFRVTGGSVAGSGQFDRVAVNGFSITTNAVAHNDSNTDTAAAIAAEINGTTSSPNYTATSDGDEVIIQAPAGSDANGRSVTVVVSGDATASTPSTFSGGADAKTSTLTDLTVNGVSIITSGVTWQGTAEATATAIANAINSASTVPEYNATAVGSAVNIIADVAGSAPNGFTVDPTLADDLEVTPFIGLTMADGEDSDAFTPGPFVKTAGSKMYAVADGLLHASGIKKPTQWTTDAVGAGFTNLTIEDADADDLRALARYQGQLAVFADNVTMIWFIDPDFTLNTLSQVLSGTGTNFPGSVTQFGDSDVFYLDTSGLRSLRARDSSNAAATTDIGVPIDDLVTAKARGLVGEEHLVAGFINPVDKRFWLVMKDEVFVFSFFENAKVSAWSTYTTTATDTDDVVTSFDVDGATVFNKRPHLRSGDEIYVYGGSGATITKDNTQAEGWLPYLDANTPTAKKQWEGIDVALSGLWEVSAATEPTNLDASEVIARAYMTSYNMGSVPYEHESSHLSLRFKSKGPGDAVFSAAVLHDQGGEDED